MRKAGNQVQYSRVHYSAVDSHFKDECFRMYWLSCRMLGLDPDVTPIPIHFIKLDPDNEKPFYTDFEEVKGVAFGLSYKIYISTDYPLEDALFTVAHEMRHIHQYEKYGFRVGYQKELSSILESDADEFATKACRKFQHQNMILHL